MIASPVISNKNFVTSDLLKLPKDVVIVVEDGQIKANKDLLSVRSDYFKVSFNNPKFIESQSKSISIKGCTEAAMRAIVDYVYTGDMDLRDYTLATLLRIMNYSREILIEDDLFNRIKEFLRNILMVNPAEKITNFLKRMDGIGSNLIIFPRKGLVKCLVLVEEFRLDNLREPILCSVSISMLLLLDVEKDAPDGVCFLRSEFEKLPYKIVKDLLMFDHGANNFNLLNGYTKSRFTLFAAWFSVNEDKCTLEEKREILESFNYMDLTGEELVKVVGRSGMFSAEEVEEMVLEKFRQYEGEGRQ